MWKIFIVLALAGCASPNYTPEKPLTTQRTVKKQAVVAYTEADLGRISDYINAKDERSFTQMITSGRAFVANPGQRVRILDCAGFACSTPKVAINGKEGYTYIENLGD